MTVNNGNSNWMMLQNIIRSKNGILILQERSEAKSQKLSIEHHLNSNVKFCHDKSSVKTGLTNCMNVLTTVIPEAHVQDTSRVSVREHVSHVMVLTATILGRTSEVHVDEEILNQIGKSFKSSLECSGVTPDQREQILSNTMPNIKSALVQLKKCLNEDMYADCLIKCVNTAKENSSPIIFNVYNNFNSKRVRAINITQAGSVNLV